MATLLKIRHHHLLKQSTFISRINWCLESSVWEWKPGTKYNRISKADARLPKRWACEEERGFVSSWELQDRKIWKNQRGRMFSECWQPALCVSLLLPTRTEWKEKVSFALKSRKGPSRRTSERKPEVPQGLITSGFALETPEGKRQELGHLAVHWLSRGQPLLSGH